MAERTLLSLLKQCSLRYFVYRCLRYMRFVLPRLPRERRAQRSQFAGITCLQRQETDRIRLFFLSSGLLWACSRRPSSKHSHHFVSLAVAFCSSGGIFFMEGCEDNYIYFQRDYLFLSTRVLKETKHLATPHKQGRQGLFSIELFLTNICQKNGYGRNSYALTCTFLSFWALLYLKIPNFVKE